MVSIGTTGKPLLKESVLHPYLPLGNEKREQVAIAMAEGMFGFSTRTYVDAFKLHDLAKPLKERCANDCNIRFPHALFATSYVRLLTIMLAAYDNIYYYIVVSRNHFMLMSC